MRVLPLLALGPLLLVGACASTCGSTKAHDEQESREQSTRPIAYVATSAGLLAIDETSVRVVDLKVEHRHTPNIGAARDGSVYVTTPFQRVRDGLPIKTPRAFVAAVAAAPDGRIWIEQSTELQVVEGDKLVTKSDALPPGCCLELAVGADGVVFGSSNPLSGGGLFGADAAAPPPAAVYRYAGGKWSADTDVESYRLPKQSVIALRGGRRGEIDVVVDDGVIRRDTRGKWRKVPLDRTMLKIADVSLREGVRLVGSVGDDGILPVLAQDGLRLVDPDGGVRRFELPVLPTSVGAVAVDGAGRVWIGGLQGLHVLSASGALVAHWPPGALPGAPEQIVISKGGPPKLPPTPPVVHGRVRGVVTHGGEPVADVEVELAPVASLWLPVHTVRSDLRFARVSDAGALVNDGRVVTRTDARGAFVFADVPRQHYEFVSYTDGLGVRISSTALNLSKRCCAKIADGETVDVGTVAIE